MDIRQFILAQKNKTNTEDDTYVLPMVAKSNNINWMARLNQLVLDANNNSKKITTKDVRAFFQEFAVNLNCKYDEEELEAISKILSK